MSRYPRIVTTDINHMYKKEINMRIQYLALAAVLVSRSRLGQVCADAREW